MIQCEYVKILHMQTGRFTRLATKKIGRLEIKKLALESVTIRIIGDTPLLTDRLDPSVVYKDEGAGKKENKNSSLTEGKIEKMWLESVYLRSDGYGFPGSGVHKAIIASGKFAGIPMTRIKSAVRVLTDETTYLPLVSLEPERDEQVGRNSNKGNAPVPAVRAKFRNWHIDVPVVYMTSELFLDDVVQLLQIAGYAVGIGAYRPEKCGPFGQFHVDKDYELKSTPVALG